MDAELERIFSQVVLKRQAKRMFLGGDIDVVDYMDTSPIITVPFEPFKFDEILQLVEAMDTSD